MEATVTARGETKDIQVISGHPLLVQSAIDAVRKWKYKPFERDGVAADVRVAVEVGFSLTDFDKAEWNRYQKTFPLLDRGRKEFRDGDFEKAEKTYRQLLELSETLLAERYLTRWHALQGLGYVYSQQKRFAEAEPFFARSLELLEQNMKPGEAEIATAVSDLARLHIASDRPDKAEPLYLRAIGIWEALVATVDLEFLTFQYRRQLTASYNQVGVLYVNGRRMEDAVVSFKRAFETGQQVYDASDLATVFRNYKGTLIALGRNEEASRVDEQFEELKRRPLLKKPPP